MNRFPSFSIENVEVNKFIIGINSVLGFSHTSKGRDEWIRRYFTTDKIAEVFSLAIKMEVSSLLGPVFPPLHEAIKKAEELTGEKITFIPTTFGKREFFTQQVQEIRALGSKFCCIHGGWTDNWKVENGKMVGLENYLKEIRDAGLIPGAASHNSENLKIMMEQDYDLAFFVTPVNKSGFYMNPTKEDALQVVSRSPKPLIAIKPLASGRFDENMISDWFEWTYSKKGVSAICVGFMSPEEAQEDIEIAKEVLSIRMPK